jgi:uncharacterized Zn-finger protein
MPIFLPPPEMPLNYKHKKEAADCPKRESSPGSNTNTNDNSSSTTTNSGLSKEKLMTSIQKLFDRPHPKTTRQPEIMKTNTGIGPGTGVRRPAKKTFACPEPNCGMEFRRKDHLSRHLKTHTGEREFPCELCGISFSRADGLAQHERTRKHLDSSPHYGLRSGTISAKDLVDILNKPPA